MITTLGSAYLAVGMVVGLVFILFGIDRIDPAARGAHAFRPLLLPGLTLLWPMVLIRWLRLEAKPPMPAAPVRPFIQKRVHRWAWTALAIVLPMLIAFTWSLRHHQVPEQPSVRLQAPQAGSQP